MRTLICSDSPDGVNQTSVSDKKKKKRMERNQNPGRHVTHPGEGTILCFTLHKMEREHTSNT
jgi:hypothetical protein